MNSLINQLLSAEIIFERLTEDLVEAEIHPGIVEEYVTSILMAVFKVKDKFLSDILDEVDTILMKYHKKGCVNCQKKQEELN